MATAQEVLDKISEQTTIVGGLKVYNADLHQRLRDAIAANNGVINQAQLDQVFVDLSTHNQEIAEAMVDNVPTP